MTRAEIAPPVPEDTVRALYEAILRRPPDEEGLVLYAGQLRSGESLASIVTKFLVSEEFQSVAGLPLPLQFPLDGARPMPVETSATAEERHRIWTHIASVWSSFGETDPFWSVLADERWRAKNMGGETTTAEFYATGEAEGQRLDAWLTRNGVALPAGAHCVEYGCGLGRITRDLARRFGSMAAYDISAPHLAGARRELGAAGIGNVSFHIVRDKADLPRESTVDLFYSIIVLQHNPPPIMLDILGNAFASLKPGSVSV